MLQVYVDCGDLVLYAYLFSVAQPYLCFFPGTSLIPVLTFPQTCTSIRIRMLQKRSLTKYVRHAGNRSLPRRRRRYTCVCRNHTLDNRFQVK